jgi:hypothetical protein
MINMTQQITMSAAFSEAQVMTKDASAGESMRSSNAVLEMMRAKIEAYQPESKMTNLDYVREMFELLEKKLSAGANYAVLAELMKGPHIDVKDGTLKTMMSKIRAERRVPRVKCPCCQSEVLESEIGEQYRDELAEQAGAVGESAA